MIPLTALAFILLSSCCTTPKPPPACEHLTITGLIDGSERFTFTPAGVKWTHLHWSEPDDLTFDGIPWYNPRKSPALWSKYATLDLPHARITQRQGRDLVALEPTADGFILYFDDSPNDAAAYSVTLAIPKKVEGKR
ncbi:hypothetical protein [Prosthecobacter fluviatilis]|uniref:Uncharacterized protein n=1 Tax=Prosthecobacter fluviatilis TaxID=445931 RepID=A0ABW0KMC0_9BACT